MSDLDIFDKRFRAFLRSDSVLQRLCTGFLWAEGPVWFAEDEHLLFSDIPNNRVMRWSEANGLSVWRQPSNFTNGHTRDRDGNLVSCEHGGRCVSRTDHSGRREVLVDRYRGKRFNSPNDVVVKSDGSVWFTDPPYGIESDYEGYKAESELNANYVFRFEPASGRIRIVADDFDRPNGLCFSPDETLLYIADSGATLGAGHPDPYVADRPHHIRVFSVGEDGDLSGGRVFAVVDPGVPDGLRVDTEGNVWTSARDGVHCYTPQGERIGRINVPETVSNLTFGGSARDRLFITATTSLYAIDLDRTGAQ